MVNTTEDLERGHSMEMESPIMPSRSSHHRWLKSICVLVIVVVVIQVGVLALSSVMFQVRVCARVCVPECAVSRMRTKRAHRGECAARCVCVCV